MSLVRVFDLGNVLVFVHEERFVERLRAASRPGAERVFFEHYERLRVDRGGEFDGVYPLLVRDVGLRMSLGELRLAWNDMFSLNGPMLEVVGESPRPRVMLSNTNEPHAGWLRGRWPEVFAGFDHVALSHEVGMRKPEVGVFRHVEGLTGRGPGEHVLIDDMSGHVAGAREAGWKGIEFGGVEECRRALAELEGGGA